MGRPGAGVTPRPAATVTLLRDPTDVGEHRLPGLPVRDAGVEVWLMRRLPTLAFAAGMHAFPGGAVDPPDHEVDAGPAGRVARVADVLGVTAADAAALCSAAVRETFEECGVLLTDPAPAAVLPADGAWEQRRLRLLGDAGGWPALLAEHGLRPAVEVLVPVARWVTPDWSPRRFDAAFFAAPVPVGQHPRWLGGEADQAGWVRARDAVRAHDRGELPMLPPTIATLRRLAEHDDVASALAAEPERVAVQDG